MSDEKRYTLEEASREMLRQSCALSGHRPDTTILDGWGRPLYALCECGEIRWTPEGRE